MLARFRADPSKVRVSIRPCGGMFRATVQNRSSGESTWHTSADPKESVETALIVAWQVKMPGIVLDKQ